jgi:hypothetical protein
MLDPQRTFQPEREEGFGKGGSGHGWRYGESAAEETVQKCKGVGKGRVGTASRPRGV